MSALHRLFFALMPDDPTRAALASAARDVRLRHQPGGRQTPVERYHLTLQFLGAYPAWPAEIAARAGEAGADVAGEAFTVDLDRASSFGTQTWWIGPLEAPPTLHRLHVGLRDALRRKGVPYERGERDAPHVTIVRDADRQLAPSPVPTVRWTPSSFVLAASGPPAGDYRVLVQWPLVPATALEARRQGDLWT